MLTARLTPTGVFAEQSRIGADLARDKGEHRRRWRLQGFERAAGIAESTKMDGEAQTISCAPLGSHERQVLRAEHIVAGHLGLVDGDAEQASTLVGRQQGARGHEGLLSMAGGQFLGLE